MVAPLGLAQSDIASDGQGELASPGGPLNINGDTVAGELAHALGASVWCF